MAGNEYGGNMGYFVHGRVVRAVSLFSFCLFPGKEKKASGV